jgi:pimeloyl-ACP methyl ester carboxylesterase
MIDRYWALNRRVGTRDTTAIRFALPYEPEPSTHLGALKMPVLILWGREDRLIPVHSAEVFQAALPQAQLIIYDQCGHIPMEERAERSAADVLAFAGAA